MSNTTPLKQRQLRTPSRLTFWSNLTYPQKFTVIAMIFALSLLAFLPLILDQNTRIKNYGTKESQGNTYLRFLWQLTTDLQTLHGASIDLQNGMGTEVDLSNALVKVEADIIALKSASQQYGQPLGINYELQDINGKWSTLQSAIQNNKSSDIEGNFITLTNSIDLLIAETGNKSYLILDPDLDTYYLMDAVLLNLTQNKSLTFQIWKIAGEAAINKDLPADKRFELGGAVNLLASNLNKLDQNLRTSVENNGNGEIEPIISLPLRNYLASNQSFINLINTYFLTSQTIQISPEVLKASYTGVQNASEDFYQSASAALGNGIQERIQSLSFRLYFSIMIATLGILIAYIIGARIMRSISLPLLRLLEATERLRAGDMNTRIPSHGNDEAGQVALAFNSLAEELENNRQTLQTRASELERRSQELATIAEVARDISIIRDLNTMLNVATSLIRESFGFSHTGIYLVDEKGEYAFLRSASGPSSQSLLDQNYKQKVGGIGIVGSVAQSGKAQVAVYPETDKLSSKTSQLPQTRSEIGLPLRGKSLTIGVLDIQSSSENIFTNREIQIFQILADQLSSAIDNAQLAQQVEETSNQLNISSRAQTKQDWDNTLKQQSLSFEYDGFQVQAVPPNLPGRLMRQLENGKPIIISKEEMSSENALEENTLLIPLLLSGQVIGVIGLERENQNSNWTSEEISIAEAAANRAAITLENARLLQDSQRRATKEQAISQATSRISTALSMENILGITAEELERVIGNSEVILQITTDAKSSAAE